MPDNMFCSNRFIDLDKMNWFQPIYLVHSIKEDGSFWEDEVPIDSLKIANFILNKTEDHDEIGLMEFTLGIKGKKQESVSAILPKNEFVEDVLQRILCNDIKRGCVATTDDIRIGGEAYYCRLISNEKRNKYNIWLPSDNTDFYLQLDEMKLSSDDLHAIAQICGDCVKTLEDLNCIGFDFTDDETLDDEDMFHKAIDEMIDTIMTGKIDWIDWGDIFYDLRYAPDSTKRYFGEFIQNVFLAKEFC